MCSSGGHIIEMEKLVESFDSNNVFLVTHKDKFLNWSTDIKKKYLLGNPLVGKANVNKFLKIILFGLYIFQVSLNELIILLRERPKMIVSTGSAIAVPMFYMGKVLGARTIYIESICRVKTLSMAGKLVYPISSDFLVQWEYLIDKYPKSKYVGTVLDKKVDSSISTNHKEYAIFLMIGTAPFPRLVKKIDELAREINGKVIMQIGRTEYHPKNAEYFTFTNNFSKIQELCRISKLVITHSGAGSIITALEQGAVVITVPRMKKYNEAYDNHQLELSEALSKKGCLKAIYNLDELGNVLNELDAPDQFCKLTSDAGLIKFLSNLH